MNCKTYIAAYPADFCGLVNLTDDIDPIEINPLILSVQEDQLKGFIGAKYYDYLVESIENSAETASDLLFIAEVKPFIIWYTYYSYLSLAQQQSTTSGMRTQLYEKAQITDKQTLDLLARKAKISANKYLNDLLRFIIDNKTDYPTIVSYCHDTSLDVVGF